MAVVWQQARIKLYLKSSNNCHTRAPTESSCSTDKNWVKVYEKSKDLIHLQTRHYDYCLNVWNICIKMTYNTGMD